MNGGGVTLHSTPQLYSNPGVMYATLNGVQMRVRSCVVRRRSPEFRYAKDCTTNASSLSNAKQVNSSELQYRCGLYCLWLSRRGCSFLYRFTVFLCLRPVCELFHRADRVMCV